MRKASTRFCLAVAGWAWVLVLGVVAAMWAQSPAPGTRVDIHSIIVVVDGQEKQTWSAAALARLPQTEFRNSRGKVRPAIILRNLLAESGIPVDRIASVKVIGLVKGGKRRGAPDREIVGDGIAQALDENVVFYSLTKHWVLSDVQTSGVGSRVDSSRVQRVTRIEVTLKSP